MMYPRPPEPSPHLSRAYYASLVRELVERRPCSAVRAAINGGGAIVLAAENDATAIRLPLIADDAAIGRVLDQIAGIPKEPTPCSDTRQAAS